MTVTVAPELAGLLARTGHTWPDVDEDRLAAMAAGWGGLATELDTVRADHSGATRSILAHNSGAGVTAFGGWASDYDGWLLQLVAGCARADDAVQDTAADEHPPRPARAARPEGQSCEEARAAVGERGGQDVGPGRATTSNGRAARGCLPPTT